MRFKTRDRFIALILVLGLCSVAIAGLVDYKGRSVIETPTGAGGVALKGNEVINADRTGTYVEKAGAPDANDDSANTGGNGTAYENSLWKDTSVTPNRLYWCLDNTATAAIWQEMGQPSVPAGLSYLGDHPSNPVFATANNAFMSILKVNKTWWAFGGTTSMYYWTSSDGISWSAATEITTGIEADGVATVWKEGSTWHMLYRGNSANRGIRYATSTNGTTWADVQSASVITGEVGQWDGADNGITEKLDPWGLIKVGSTYYLWYNTVTGADRGTGLATSTDLLTWTKDGANPIFNPMFCAWVWKQGSWYYLALADQGAGLGQPLRMYRDSSPTFYAADREDLGIVMESNSVTWKYSGLDTPCVPTDDVHRDTYRLTNGQIWFYYCGKNASAVWTTGLAIDSTEPYIAPDRLVIGLPPSDDEAGVDIHIYRTNPVFRQQDDTGGRSDITRTMSGYELVSGTMNVTTAQYGQAIKWMSTDSAFTTESPKYTAGIVGRATQIYNGDTDGGMALDFLVTADDPGATSVPSAGLTIASTGVTVPSGNLIVAADASELQFGAAGDYTIQWDGLDAVNTIVAGDFVFTGGNMGIGTATPDGKLHVFTSSAGSVTANANFNDAVVEIGGANGGFSVLTDDAQRGGIAFGSPSDNLGAAIDWQYSSSSMRIRTSTANGEISLMTGNSVAAVRIDETGRVGIGTISPVVELEVAGEIRHTGTTGGFNERVSEATGTATAATTFDIEVNIPSGARIIGCQLRVDTALTSSDGGTTWTAAYIDGSTSQVGTALAFAKDTKKNTMYDVNLASDIASAETDIRVTCDGAKTFAAGGVVRAIVYYEDFTFMDNAP